MIKWTALAKDALQNEKMNEGKKPVWEERRQVASPVWGMNERRRRSFLHSMLPLAPRT